MVSLNILLEKHGFIDLGNGIIVIPTDDKKDFTNKISKFLEDYFISILLYKFETKLNQYGNSHMTYLIIHNIVNNGLVKTVLVPDSVKKGILFLERLNSIYGNHAVYETVSGSILKLINIDEILDDISKVVKDSIGLDNDITHTLGNYMNNLEKISDNLANILLKNKEFYEKIRNTILTIMLNKIQAIKEDLEEYFRDDIERFKRFISVIIKFKESDWDKLNEEFFDGNIVKELGSISKFKFVSSDTRLTYSPSLSEKDWKKIYNEILKKNDLINLYFEGSEGIDFKEMIRKLDEITNKYRKLTGKFLNLFKSGEFGYQLVSWILKETLKNVLRRYDIRLKVLGKLLENFEEISIYVDLLNYPLRIPDNVKKVTVTMLDLEDVEKLGYDYLNLKNKVLVIRVQRLPVREKKIIQKLLEIITYGRNREAPMYLVFRKRGPWNLWNELYRKLGAKIEIIGEDNGSEAFTGSVDFLINCINNGFFIRETKEYYLKSSSDYLKELEDYVRNGNYDIPPQVPGVLFRALNGVSNKDEALALVVCSLKDIYMQEWINLINYWLKGKDIRKLYEYLKEINEIKSTRISLPSFPILDGLLKRDVLKKYLDSDVVEIFNAFFSRAMKKNLKYDDLKYYWSGIFYYSLLATLLHLIKRERSYVRINDTIIL